MKRRVHACVAVLALFAQLAVPGPADATICAMDRVPAATLLVPFFEVDASCGSLSTNTVISVSSASTNPALVRVTLWSDLAVPVLGFDVYLSGYDLLSLDLGRVLCDGFLPSTGSGVSNLGSLSTFGTFPGCNAGSDSLGGAPVYGGDGALSVNETTHLRSLLRGVVSPSSGQCAGFPHGDGIARGYVTLDNITACANANPSEAGYYTQGLPTLTNQLLGDYEFLDAAGNVTHSHGAVAIEADASLTGILGGPTFYGRYDSEVLGFRYSDGREPLPTAFSAPFAIAGNSGVADTFVTVWREANADAAQFTCGVLPSWYPIGTSFPAQAATVFIDAASNIGGPPPRPQADLFGLATQRVSVASLAPPFNAGWLRTNLQNVRASTTSKSKGQAWVSIDQSGAGTGTSIGHPAQLLDAQCPPTTVFQNTPVSPGNPEVQ